MTITSRLDFDGVIRITELIFKKERIYFKNKNLF